MCIEFLEHLAECSAGQSDDGSLTFMMPDDVVAFNRSVRPSVRGYLPPYEIKEETEEPPSPLEQPQT